VWKKRADVALDKQIFRGLVFCKHSCVWLIFLLLTLHVDFFPNNDDDMPTRARIHQAVKYGASWAHHFCEEVTHIIVTRHQLDVTKIAKYFPDKEIPVSSFRDTLQMSVADTVSQKGPLLLDNWLWDSWDPKATYLKDTRLLAYQVQGSEALNRPVSIACPPTSVYGSTKPTEPHEPGVGAERYHNSELRGEATNPEVDGHGVDDALEVEIRKAHSGGSVQVDLDSSDDTESDDDVSIPQNLYWSNQPFHDRPSRHSS
jgi:hypothetical protein